MNREMDSGLEIGVFIFRKEGEFVVVAFLQKPIDFHRLRHNRTEAPIPRAAQGGLLSDMCIPRTRRRSVAVLL